MRIAVRQGGVLSYLAGDHLGSTSLTLDASGNKNGEMKYYPYGETRLGYPIGSVPTDRRFTGQRQEDAAALGSLYDYGARAYSPYLNRWLSPDTIVPDPANPQSLNRFSYTRNNPLKYTDPSGHVPCDGEKSSEVRCTQATQQEEINADGASLIEQACSAPGMHCNPSLGETLAFGVVGFTAMGLGPALIAKGVGVLCSIGARCFTGVAGGATSFAGSVGSQLMLTGKVDWLDALLAGITGFGAGYVMPGTPAQAAFVYGTAGAAQSAASDVLHGKNVSLGPMLLNAGIGGLLGYRFGALPEPSRPLLQASVSEIWNAAHGSTEAAASLAFKAAKNAWRYVPPTFTLLNLGRSTVSSLISNGLPSLLVNSSP